MAHVINNVSDQRALLLAEEHVTNEYRVKLDTGEVVFWSKTISSLETSGGSIRRHILDKCCNQLLAVAEVIRASCKTGLVDFESLIAQADECEYRANEAARAMELDD